MSRRRGARQLGLVVLVVAAFTMAMLPAAATIDGVSPGSLTVGAGDTGGAQVNVTSVAGSCLTATASAPGIEIGVNPGCASAGTPVFTLTVIVEADVAPGVYEIALREFDAARDQLLDTAVFTLQVDSDTPPTTTTTTAGPTTTITTAAPPTTTTTAGPTTTATSTSTTSSTTTSTTTSTTSTTIAPEPGTTRPSSTTEPPATVPSTTLVEAPTTTATEDTAVVQPAVETGLSPVLTILAFVVLGALAWMLFRVQGGGSRVRYRRLVDPERLAAIHRTFRDAGQGAPAAIRTAGASSSRLDVAITPLSSPDAPVDVEVLIGAPWSRQRARVVALKADGAMQLQVQRGEAGLADVPDGEEAAQTWLDGLARDLEAYGDGRGAAAIKRWLQP